MTIQQLERARERSRKRYWFIKSNPELLAEFRIRNKLNVQKWRKENTEKRIAYNKVFVAIRNGTLKKGICFCGNKKTQAHHEDYERPLDVVWYCKLHHMEIHKKKRGITSY